MRLSLRALGLALACAAGGCASPTVPGSPSVAAMAADQARRDERIKIMQQYWYDATEALRADAGPAPNPERLLDYPAGSYSGINFGARRAVDPSLAEPLR